MEPRQVFLIEMPALAELSTRLHLIQVRRNQSSYLSAKGCIPTRLKHSVRSASHDMRSATHDRVKWQCPPFELRMFHYFILRLHQIVIQQFVNSSTRSVIEGYRLSNVGTVFDMMCRGARLGVSPGERDPNNLPPAVPRMVFGRRQVF